MYTSIRFIRLQLHAGNDVDSSTLSKTTAVYENEYFIYNQKDSSWKNSSSVRIKESIRKNSIEVSGEYTDIVHRFMWYLN